jgi:prepilin-type N-terminal cleavage/methylation domain-containing protein
MTEKNICFNKNFMSKPLYPIPYTLYPSSRASRRPFTPLESVPAALSLKRKRSNPVSSQENCGHRRTLTGFTLIEIVIVVAIIGAVTLVAALGLFGRKRSTDLATVKLGIVAVLHEAQSRSTTEAQNASWGVHFASVTGTASFYALFYNSYSISTVVSQYVLPSDVQFATSSVASGGSLDITFAQITGMPSASTSITLNLVSGGGTAPGASASVGRQSSGKVFFDDFNRSSL